MLIIYMSTKIRYGDDAKLIQDKVEMAVFPDVTMCSLADGYERAQCY
jgi:hypothetical protein